MADSKKRNNAMVNAGAQITSLFPVLDSETRHCDRHGSYTSQKVRLPIGERWGECEKCHSELIAAEDAEIIKQAKAERERIRIEAMLGRAAIPKRFMDRSLENFKVESLDQEKALRSATRYAHDWKENHTGASLIFCGKPGTGKTHLAVGIARHVMSEGGTAMFARMIDLARSVRETYEPVWDNEGGQRKRKLTEREVIERFSLPDILIIDEVGHQHGTDFERMILFEVINARYEECRPVILITNLTLDELKQYLDSRAEDRLREGGGRAVVFDWESYRGRI